MFNNLAGYALFIIVVVIVIIAVIGTVQDRNDPNYYSNSDSRKLATHIFELKQDISRLSTAIARDR